MVFAPPSPLGVARCKRDNNLLVCFSFASGVLEKHETWALGITNFGHTSGGASDSLPS